MPTLEVSGSYVGVEQFRAASKIQATTDDAVILDHLLAASRDIERLTLRRFFPVIATNYYRWPPFHVSASWEVWTEDDLLSVTLLQAQASGQHASPVNLANFYLEPQQYGPPYNRIEIDLSSSDVFTAGPTPQRSIGVTGLWGYCNTTTPAGTLAAALTTTGVTTATVSVPTPINQGDVLLIDAEAIYVDLSPALGAGDLVIQRGVNGTTPATHLIDAPVSRYQAPASIRRVVRADAIGTFQQDLANWGRTVGQGDMAVEFQGKMAKSYRQTVIDEYRRARFAAV